MRTGNTMTDDGHSRLSISALSLRKQLAFALLVFERMLPGLVTFSRDTGFDYSCCLEAREAVWSALHSAAMGLNFQSFAEACLEHAPDTEDFSHTLTSSALNAILAMNDIVEFVVDGNPDHIDRVSTLARDSVYLYVTYLEQSTTTSSEREQRIAGHPIVCQELQQETKDVQFLSGLPDVFDDEIVSAIKTRSKNQSPMIPFP